MCLTVWFFTLLVSHFLIKILLRIQKHGTMLFDLQDAFVLTSESGLIFTT